MTRSSPGSGDGGGIVDLTMVQRWPIASRPYREAGAYILLITGSGLLIFLSRGQGGRPASRLREREDGYAAKLAKWADAEIVVYIGCGERGNEMTDVLMEFPRLTDPASGEPLMKRTVLIANTSNIPVAARRPLSTPGSPWPNISGIWATAWLSWLTPPPAGQRRCARCRGRLEEMPGEEDIPLTSDRAWQSFTNGPAGRLRWAAKGAKGAYRCRERSPRLDDLSNRFPRLLRIAKVLGPRCGPGLQGIFGHQLALELLFYLDSVAPYFRETVGEWWNRCGARPCAFWEGGGAGRDRPPGGD